MLRALVAVLACLSVAPPATAGDTHPLRARPHATHKDLTSILASIDDRLRVLDAVTAVQAKQSRRLDIMQDKLDHVETTLSLKLDRAQLAAERLEYQLNMLQNNLQDTIKEGALRLEQSQNKVAEIGKNLTKHLDSYKHLLEKVNGAYVETWTRGLMLENLMRSGLSLINVTRRELADGLHALARRQRDARMTSSELESAFSRRLNDNTYKIDMKMQELLDAQKKFVDSCQTVQQDDPSNVADVLDRLVDSLINKTASTFRELQNIHSTMRNHDNKMMKIISAGRSTQNEVACKKLESALKNTSLSTFKESELLLLTDKFVALTNRADAVLQRLELRLGEKDQSELSAEAGRLLFKLNGINSEEKTDDDQSEDEEDSGYFEDEFEEDMMEEDRRVLRSGHSAAAPPRRHPHKHPYDRGPRKRHTHT